MATNKCYVCADLHLNHEKAVIFRGFRDLEEMNSTIINNWNNKVNKDDTVWVLGDVGFKGVEGLKLVKELKGNKKLILGNHDHLNLIQYFKYFSSVKAMAERKGYLMTHIPVHQQEITGVHGRWKGNIHGHLHNRFHPDDWIYQCVSMENVDYTPILFDDVVERFNAATLSEAYRQGETNV